MKLLKTLMLGTALLVGTNGMAAANPIDGEMSAAAYGAVKRIGMTDLEEVLVASIQTGGAATGAAVTFENFKAMVLAAAGGTVAGADVLVGDGAQFINADGDGFVAVTAAQIAELGATDNMADFTRAFAAIYRA